MTVQVKRANQEINVNITDMDNVLIMKFLRDILTDDTKVLNVPITQPLTVNKTEEQTSVSYPTFKNLLEPTEDNFTTPSKGTDVLTDVSCPCGYTYQRISRVGGVVVCGKCKKTLYVEPGIEGRYKAVKVFK